MVLVLVLGLAISQNVQAYTASGTTTLASVANDGSLPNNSSAASQGTTNTYYVTAVNLGGESGSSNTISVAFDSTLPAINYFSVNDGSSFSRKTTPVSSGVSTQTINSDGSVTVSGNSAPGYADSGLTLYSGTLGDLPNFTVSGTGSYGLNLWFDSNNDGSILQWDSNGVLTSLNGDLWLRTKLEQRYISDQWNFPVLHDVKRSDVHALGS